jgi:glycosyltransferase involved in cell wall biosynthesis
MFGRHKGYLMSQGLLVADRLEAEGDLEIITTSSAKNRYRRLLDIVTTLVRARRRIHIQCIEVYAGPSFVVEDLASFLGTMLGHRVVMVLHGGTLPVFMRRFPRWSRRVLGRADALVAPSRYQQRAIEAFGLKARIIPNVLDLADYPFRVRSTVQPRLFWMRSFHPIWNPEMAVRVLARIRRVLPNATLVMAGQDKGLQPQVERLAKELGVADATRFPGFLDRDAKVREGQAADIFLNTNRIDNMPVAVVEACAMGLPVVSTDVGGIPDLLTHEQTGLLVPDDDDEAMAAAVLRLVRDHELAERLSRKGAMVAERSRWEHVRAEWHRLFAELGVSAMDQSSEFAR